MSVGKVVCGACAETRLYEMQCRDSLGILTGLHYE